MRHHRSAVGWLGSWLALTISWLMVMYTRTQRKCDWMSKNRENIQTEMHSRYLYEHPKSWMKNMILNWTLDTKINCNISQSTSVRFTLVMLVRVCMYRKLYTQICNNKICTMDCVLCGNGMGHDLTGSNDRTAVIHFPTNKTKNRKIITACRVVQSVATYNFLDASRVDGWCWVRSSCWIMTRCSSKAKKIAMWQCGYAIPYHVVNCIWNYGLSVTLDAHSAFSAAAMRRRTQKIILRDTCVHLLLLLYCNFSCWFLLWFFFFLVFHFPSFLLGFFFHLLYARCDTVRFSLRIFWVIIKFNAFHLCTAYYYLVHV